MFSVSALASFVLTVTSMIANQNLSKPLPAVSIPPGLFLQIRKQINLTVFGREKSAPLKQKAGRPQSGETSSSLRRKPVQRIQTSSPSQLLKDLNYDDKF